MKNHPIHENLDTSFVNLAALMRYLRGRGFIGSVRLVHGGYEAEITLLGEENQLKVREHDRIAGRIAEGEEALQRLLIRAREPGGTINVYQSIAEPQTAQPEVRATAKTTNVKPFVQKEISRQTPPQPPSATTTANGAAKRNENKFEAPNKFDVMMPPRVKETGAAAAAAAPPHADQSFPPKNNPAAPLPLEFSNRVEEKARQTQMTPEDWQMLLQLTGELLGAVDKSLAAAELDFARAFAKACTEICDDYPFLNPSAGTFGYAGGTVTMREQTSAKLFAASINEALRRILEKLGANPKFADVYRNAVQSILALLHQRKPLYDKFFITPQLEKNLGA
jgi:hypothetical protein